jgi:membrane fusion protein, multidrug efflux system
MKKFVIVAVGALALAGAYYAGTLGGGASQSAATDGAGGGRGRAGGRGDVGAGGAGARGARGGRGGAGQFGRAPMAVELAQAHRASIAAEVTVVGNLVGEVTVAVAPRAAGRLQDLYVRLGDRVRRGQRLAKIEDFEIREQVKQAEAAQEVSQATIRQREADLKLAETNVERSRNLFQRQLLPKQTLDDNEARYQSAVASVDLARAQSSQSKARLDELSINLANTDITSPVNGFVARRGVDPGAFVSQNTPVLDVVDISTVRLVANVVEKDLKEMQTGDATKVEVDAYPGEQFMGRIARVSPVLDPATRTAPIEVEIPNRDYRLKPGMYARVGITTDTRKEALVVPANAVVDLGGRRGVFTPLNESAVFRAITVGTEQRDVVEILGGLAEGDTVITTGSGALRDGDSIVLPGGRGGARAGGARAGGAESGRAGTGRSGSGRPGGPSAGDDPNDGAATGASPTASRDGGPRGGTARSGGARSGGARDGVAREGGRGFPAGGRRFGGDGSGRRGAPPADGASVPSAGQAPGSPQ